MSIRKLATIRFLLEMNSVTLNQPRDFPGVVSEDGPKFPARLLEGPWTTFHTNHPEFGGDNGVLWQDAVAVKEGLDRGTAELKTGIQMNRGTGRAQETYSYISLNGMFVVEVDIYEKRALPALLNFILAFDRGEIRLGNRQSVGGVCRLVGFPKWIKNVKKSLQPEIFLDDMVQLHPSWFETKAATRKIRAKVFKCENGHNQPMKIRQKGGICIHCGAEVAPEWFTWLPQQPNGEPRVYGERLPMVEPVEVVLNRDLGLELPKDLKRSYLPAGSTSTEPVHPVIEVKPKSLKKAGLPAFPWKWDGMCNWRSRLDILAGMALIFASQPGVEISRAVTCAAVIHRVLTRFRLTSENSGEWAGLVYPKAAEAVYDQIMSLVVHASPINFHAIVFMASRLLDIPHAPSLEFVAQEGKEG